MRTYEKPIAAALLAMTLAWAAPVLAQSDGDSNSSQEERTPVLRERIRESNRLLSRLLENPDLAPEELQLKLAELQESMEAIRSAWIAEYRPGEGATAEEIKAAREAFQEAYADQIQSNKELRVDVMAELRANIREAIDESEWNVEARALYKDYKEIQAQLAESWKAIRDVLGPEATREEIAAARERFKAEYADLIARQKELAKQVRELIAANREPPEFGRDPLPPELRELRRDVAVLRSQMRERKVEAREEMEGMSPEEREAYRRSLLEDLKEIHDDIKERRRQVIDEIRDGQDGDRRPEG